MQIFADDQGTFCLVFAFYFADWLLQFEFMTAICDVAVQQFECSIVTEISKQG